MFRTNNWRSYLCALVTPSLQTTLTSVSHSFSLHAFAMSTMCEECPETSMEAAMAPEEEEPAGVELLPAKQAESSESAEVAAAAAAGMSLVGARPGPLQPRRVALFVIDADGGGIAVFLFLECLGSLGSAA